MTPITTCIIAQAPPAPASQNPAPNPLSQLVPLALMGVMFYVLLIRPQQKKAKEHKLLLASVKSGDRVVTMAGIHGIIANVKESTLLLKIAENVKIEIDKESVARVEKPAQIAQP